MSAEEVLAQIIKLLKGKPEISSVDIVTRPYQVESISTLESLTVTQATTASTTPVNVINIASGSGWIKYVTQIQDPYAFGVNNGHVEVTIDGASLGDIILSIASFAGSYPGSLEFCFCTPLMLDIKYETSLKVEHYIDPDASTPTVTTTVVHRPD